MGNPISIYIVSIWFFLFLVNNLIFKYFVLKQVKQDHCELWEEMGSPNILSMKESTWILIGFPNEINLRKKLISDVSGIKTIKLLNSYRISTIIEVIILFIAIGFLLWK